MKMRTQSTYCCSFSTRMVEKASEIYLIHNDKHLLGKSKVCLCRYTVLLLLFCPYLLSSPPERAPAPAPMVTGVLVSVCEGNAIIGRGSASVTRPCSEVAASGVGKTGRSSVDGAKPSCKGTLVFIGKTGRLSVDGVSPSDCRSEGESNCACSV